MPIPAGDDTRHGRVEVLAGERLQCRDRPGQVSTGDVDPDRVVVRIEVRFLRLRGQAAGGRHDENHYRDHPDPHTRPNIRSTSNL